MMIFLFSFASNADTRWTLDVESGAVLPGYNNIAIPGDGTGTRFSLKNDLEIKEKIYYRLRLSYRLSEKHMLSALYAPLSLDAGGALPIPVSFQGVDFDQGEQVDALYMFNSYRLTYRYRLIGKPNLKLWIGFTAKIRDADIRVESSDKAASKANVGFVPLLNLYLEWLWNPRTGMLVEVDALAAEQGRAEDVAVSFFYRFNKNVDFRLGYRLVEGGADNDTVYTFALINYLHGGLVFRF